MTRYFVRLASRNVSRIGPVLAAGIILLAAAACGGGDDGRAEAQENGKEGAKSGRVAAPSRDSAAIADSLRRGYYAQLARDTAGAGAAKADTTGRVRFNAGESPAFAADNGWPKDYGVPLPGSILPYRRIVAYYGNPLSRRMGALGEFDKDDMLARLDREVQAWRQADPQTPVVPALHLITVVAQGDAGPSGHYRAIMRDTLVEMVYGWAREKNALMFVDVQVGLSTIQTILPHMEKFLVRPDVHLGIDPEFMMQHRGVRPGLRVGTLTAADANWAINWLSELVKKHNLPPKVLVIHRFTRPMVANAEAIRPTPQVQVVMDMDGWGAAWLKRDSYHDYIVRHPVQFTGFKLFYHNDTKKGDPLMQPAEVLRLRPRPLYIQYQ